MNFKGFGDWIEIFKGGKQTDSAGRDHNGDEVIDKIITNFKPGRHEPPVVIGHPKDNAPAYGWVEGLKAIFKNGVKVLLARFKQVVPEFEGMVQKGMFKKRSISVYPDGSLRHVAFLGAAPPAVKGQEDLNWSEGDRSFNFETFTEVPVIDFQDDEIDADKESSRRILRHVNSEFMNSDTHVFNHDNESAADFKAASRILRHLNIETSFKEDEVNPDTIAAYRILRHCENVDLAAFKESGIFLSNTDEEITNDIEAANRIIRFVN